MHQNDPDMAASNHFESLATVLEIAANILAYRSIYGSPKTIQNDQYIYRQGVTECESCRINPLEPGRLSTDHLSSQQRTKIGHAENPTALPSKVLSSSTDEENYQMFLTSRTPCLIDEQQDLATVKKHQTCTIPC